MYLKEKFLTDWENILKIPSDFSRIENNISLISKGEEYNKYIYIYIYISDRRYFPHGAYIDGVSASVSYHKVEQILNKAYEKAGVKKRNGGNSTIQIGFKMIDGIDYSVFNIEINSLEAFQVVNSQVQKIIKYYALPFFEQYDTLEKIANLLADKKPQEVTPYIQGAVLFPKTILILKLANHSNFSKKLIEYYGVLKKQAEKKDVYKDTLTVFLELFEEDLNLIEKGT